MGKVEDMMEPYIVISFGRCLQADMERKRPLPDEGVMLTSDRLGIGGAGGRRTDSIATGLKDMRKGGKLTRIGYVDLRASEINRDSTCALHFSAPLSSFLLPSPSLFLLPNSHLFPILKQSLFDIQASVSRAIRLNSSQPCRASFT